MDLVDNFRKQVEKEQKAAAGDTKYVNQELVKKIEQIEDEMMNPKAW
jgi:hypothetical protein